MRVTRPSLSLAALLLLGAAGAPQDAAKTVDRGCPPERAPDGEVRIVFLGDSGYGQGFAEWGAQGQDAIAISRKLCSALRPIASAVRPSFLPSSSASASGCRRS